MTDVIERGEPSQPALVCVPGLLGGPENFEAMIDRLAVHFHVMVLDPNADRRAKGGLNSLDERTMQEVEFRTTSSRITELLNLKRHERAYLLGLSLGGKIVYDFAIRYPDRFAGGTITDVGLDPFEASELYQYVIDFVESAPLHLAWPDFKEVLNKRLPDRNLRTLIKTQVHYPNQRPPAVWRTAMKNFGSMLEGQSIGHQMKAYLEIESILLERGARIRVLLASRLSGIDSKCLEEMKRLRSIDLIPIEDSTHFIHVSHRERIEDCAIAMLKR